VLKAALCRVVDTEAGLAKASHDFARVRPEGGAHLMHIFLVIVPAEDRVKGAALRDPLGDIRVVIDRQLLAAKLQLRVLAMQRHVLIAGGNLRQQERIPIVIAEHRVDWSGGEAIGDLLQGEGRAEVSQKEQGLALQLCHLLQGGLEIPDVVVAIGEDGDLHARKFIRPKAPVIQRSSRQILGRQSLCEAASYNRVYHSFNILNHSAASPVNRSRKTRYPMRTVPVLLAALLLSILPLQAQAPDASPAPTATNDAPLKVAIRNVPPFAMQDQAGQWRGISVALWDEIADRQGWDYEWVDMPLQDTLEAVEAGEVDAAIAALTITSERENVFDFTHPYIVSGLSLAHPEQGHNAWAATIRGFFSWAFLRTILSLSILLLAVGAAVWFFERRANTEQFQKDPRKGLGDGFWWSAVTMTTVGYGDKAPASLGGRLVALFWMFASLILIATFTASIAASLTANTLGADILENKNLSEIRVGVLESSAAKEFAESQGARTRVYEDLPAAFEALEAERVEAVMHDRPILQHFLREADNDFVVSERTLVRDDYGFALPTGSPLREEINGVLLTVLHEPTWQQIRLRLLGEGDEQ